MKKTIRDVAAAAGVSPATVSRVLNSPESVGEETKLKVQEAMKTLGFTPNAIARGLSVQKTNTIGLLVPGISHYFFSEIYAGIEEVARSHGKNILLFDSLHSIHRALDGFTFLKQHQVEGIIFTSRPVTRDYDSILARVGVPVVLALTQSFGEFPLKSVRADDLKASYDAVSYLISRGHRRIGMISAPVDDMIAGIPRFDGYRNALRQYAISGDDDWVEYGEFRFEHGYHAMSRLLEKQERNQLTAVFAAGDEMAMGAIRCLYDQGLKVPEDISIIGYDNLPIARMGTPSLTTVAQPFKEIGTLAVQHLLKAIQGQTIQIDGGIQYVPHHIVERESVRAI